jgi:surfeit locus 1 family protein
MVTWFALAAMTVFAFVVFVRQDARRRQGAGDA